jgi:hypothetical protein
VSDAVGNDRFMHVASPGYTSKKPGGLVWWPLRLNDMDRECAVVIAMLSNQLNNALGSADHCRYNRERMQESWPAREVIRDYKLAYDPWSKDEVADAILESEMREEIYRTAADYLRELLEAAYVC